MDIEKFIERATELGIKLNKYENYGDIRKKYNKHCIRCM